MVIVLVLLAAVTFTVAVTLGVIAEEAAVTDRAIWLLTAVSITGAMCATVMAVGERIVREIRAGHAVERILRDEDSLTNIRRVR